MRWSAGALLGASVVAAGAFAACSKKTNPPPPPTTVVPTNRCEADLSAILGQGGAGVTGKKIESASELIGGEAASGRLGDYLLANDKIRVIVQQPGRVIGPNPYGGAIIDADQVHGGPGNDKFGKMALFFNFGRTINPTAAEVINSGSQGGAAVLAFTGTDEVADYINIKNVLGQYLPAGSSIQLDPDVKVGLNVTTYYVLQPGQSRVTVLSALCNPTQADARITAGDLIDSGGAVDFFTPQAQTGGFGYVTNPDAVTWLGWMAQDGTVAYGIAPYKLNDPTTPETHSNALTTAGVTGYVIGNKPGLSGLLEWVDPNGRNRSGGITVPAGGKVVVARDFVVGKDLGEVASTIEQARSAKTGVSLGEVHGTVLDSLGPVAGARVVAERKDPDGIGAVQAFPDGGQGSLMREAVFVTGADGTFTAKLPAEDYTFTPWQEGRLVGEPKTVSVAAGGTTEVGLALGATHTLNVTLADTAGHAGPGKVTVRCADALGHVTACPVTPIGLSRFSDHTLDPRPDEIERIAFIPPSGQIAIPLPPGKYDVIVSRGPEYSLYPLTAPDTGALVDLSTAASASVAAKVSKVVDTHGWMSADFHVHCVNSPDSPVPVATRVATFLAEDVNVLTSTDHDYITDFAPTNQALGGTPFMATMVGEEITTFDYGHYNPFPIVSDPNEPVANGALDWSGGDKDGDKPPLSIDEIIDGARTKLQAKTVQINHPNGGSSTFGATGLDADTLATHQPASKFRLTTPAGATAEDTGLFPKHKWDAMEVMNGFTHSSFIGLLNNWATFLGNGMVVAATAVSDTHSEWSSAAGYPRSYVRMAHDQVQGFDPNEMSAAVNALKLQGSLGAFVRTYACKTGSTPALPVAVDQLDAAMSAAHCVGVGETLPVDASGLDIVVDIQAPDWVPFDTVELLDHRMAHPMRGGVANTTLGPLPGGPTAGYWKQSVTLDPAGPEHEATFQGDGSLGCGAGQSSCSTYRWHVQKVFHVTGADAPAADEFYWVVVRESGTGRDLMPLVYDKTRNQSGANVAVGAYTFTFTNAIFADRDGNGYDHFPGVHAPTPVPPRPAKRFQNAREALQTMLQDLEAER